MPAWHLCVPPLGCTSLPRCGCPPPPPGMYKPAWPVRMQPPVNPPLTTVNTCPSSQRLSTLLDCLPPGPLRCEPLLMHAPAVAGGAPCRRRSAAATQPSADIVFSTLFSRPSGHALRSFLPFQSILYAVHLDAPAPPAGARPLPGLPRSACPPPVRLPRARLALLPIHVLTPYTPARLPVHSFCPQKRTGRYRTFCFCSRPAPAALGLPFGPLHTVGWRHALHK